MFKSKNFCHIASNNRNTVKVGVFVYRTTDDLDTVTASGYFNERIIDINLHDLIIHEQIDIADNTKVIRNVLCVSERTLDNVNTIVVKSQWEGDIEQEIEDLRTYVDNTFVKKDGSSVMTGPLKFRAGSFVGAIAGGLGDGISIYKLKNDNSIDSEVASLTKTNGFTPGSTNTMDIGRNNLKWKDLYVTRVITAVINNGADISVQAKAGTMALMSDVEMAANSGSQLWATGVWYAKMYAGTTAPAAEDGTNYADFSQTDVDNNPIIVIYERQSGAWVQIDTITPPATYNGYLYVTSKIWDIAEQAGQQGGQVLWSYSNKTFTPYPRIISFEDIEVTGDSTVVMPAVPSSNQIVNKDYVDSQLGSAFANTSLSNLTDEGKNISNWSNNATNCITSVPQDINMELSSGSITLKTGSKIYIPNGSGVFDTYTIASDITFSSANGYFWFLNPAKTGVAGGQISNCYSGSTAPAGSNGVFWYDTTNNTVKRHNGSSWVSGYSLPIGLTESTGILRVFNGFGYMHMTRWVLPNTNGLIPDGFNTDGTAKNIPMSTTSVQVTTYTSGTSLTEVDIWLTSTGAAGGANANIKYHEETNKVLYDTDGTQRQFCSAGKISISAGVITSFKPKKAFSIVDYNNTDVDFVVESMLPTSSNNYKWYRKYKSGWVEQGQTISTADTTITLPVPMADTNYTIVGVGFSVANYGTQYFTAKTKTSFTTASDRVTCSTSSWYVCGMAA